MLNQNVLNNFINKELDKLQNLFEVNKLNLNVSETSFMVFGKGINDPGIEVIVNNENIN